MAVSGIYRWLLGGPFPKELEGKTIRWAPMGSICPHTEPYCETATPCQGCINDMRDGLQPIERWGKMGEIQGIGGDRENLRAIATKAADLLRESIDLVVRLEEQIDGPRPATDASGQDREAGLYGIFQEIRGSADLLKGRLAKLAGTLGA